MSSQIVWRTFHQAGRDQILQAEVDLPLQQFQSHFLITCCRGRDPAIDRKKKLVYFDEKRSDFTKKKRMYLLRSCIITILVAKYISITNAAYKQWKLSYVIFASVQ